MLFSLILLTISLLSQFTAVSPQQTFAVVVGVSDYKLGLPNRGDLNYSDDDARSFSDLLQSRAGGNVPVANIRLLIDKEASLANIVEAMTIFQNATPNDRIIFFFSGHGDEGLFLPYDAYTTGPDLVLRHADVKAAFRQSLAGTKFLMADACMSGSMTKKVYEHALHPIDSTAAHDTSSIHQGNPNSDVVVMLSSLPNQQSQESKDLKNGTFTYYLVKGIKGAADTSPYDGIVTIKELHIYISRKVMARTLDKQTPEVFGRFRDDLAFTPPTP